MKSLEQKLARMDLNLLVALNVMLQEKNISRAAVKLCVTQSAMSKTLQRIRILFDDRILERVGREMQPTAKGLMLASKLPLLLEQFADLLDEEEFEPYTYRGEFKLVLPPLYSSVLLPSLLKLLIKSAPHVRLTEPIQSENVELQLQSGELDFAIQNRGDLTDKLKSTYLGKVNPIIIARKHHPLANQALPSFEECYRYKFLDLLIAGKSNINLAPKNNVIVQELLDERDIFFSSNNINQLFSILNETDTLLIVGDIYKTTKDFEQNFSVIYDFKEDAHVQAAEIFLVQNKRFANNKPQQWFYQQLMLVAGDVFYQ